MTLNDDFTMAAKDDCSKASWLIDKIIAERPDLAEAAFYVPSRGACSITVLTENEVFKAPIDLKTTPEFYREIHIMQLLAKNNVPHVPRVLSLGKERDFFSMNRIRGVTFASIYDGLSAEAKHVIAAEYGQARAELQKSIGKIRLPVSRTFNDQSAPASATKALKLWQKPYMESAVSQLPPEMSGILNEFFARHKTRELAFCHSDVHGGNVLVDPDTLKITGFIDLARSYQSKWVEYEFEHSLNYFLLKDLSYVKTAYEAYASALGPAYNKTDLFCYEALGTLGFWLHDADRKAPDIVKRGIFNCVEDIPKRHGRYLQFDKPGPQA